MSVAINTWTATSGIHFKFSTIFAESDDFLNYFGFRIPVKVVEYDIQSKYEAALGFLAVLKGHFAIKIVSVITRFHYICKNLEWNMDFGTTNLECRAYVRGFYEYLSLLSRISFFLGNNFLRELLNYE